ncbi:MAG: antA/AntB antirepressor family protein [Deltaproteobacteria bacterium]|jgi:phage anti-repressor protein/phage antirepressor YoqD-like protein|nr:antA/AntB antirepressor family protein [Deltaproteobacteria bacterium]
MSTDLIEIKPARIGGKDVFIISARDVHGRLGVGRQFNHWIKERIEKHGFLEGVDYVAVANLAKTTFGGAPVTEYMVTTDMAQDLAAAEGSPVSVGVCRDIRNAVMARLKAPVKLDYDLIIELAKKAKANEARIGLLEAQAEADRPIKEMGETVMGSELNITFGDMSSILQNKKIRINFFELFQWAREMGFLIRTPDTRENAPSRKALDMGILAETIARDSRGHPHTQAVFTPAGVKYTIAWFLQHRDWKPSEPIRKSRRRRRI